MIPEAVTTCYDDIIERLRLAKSRMVRLASADGGAWACIVFLVVSGAVLALDQFFGFSILGRAALLVLALITGAVLFCWLGLGPLIRAALLGNRDLSLRLEEHFPAIESRVVTVTDLSPKLQDADTEVQKGFLELAVKTAHDDTRSVDFLGAFPSKRTAQLSAGAGALLLATLLLAVLNPDGLWAAIGRFTGLAQEYAEAHAQVSLLVEVAETETVHIVKRGTETEVAAIRGSDVHVSISAQTNVEAPLRMYSRDAGEEDFEETLLDAAQTETIAAPEVASDVEFYFRLGPTQTSLFRVRATDYPKISNVQIRLKFPDYTKVRPQFIPMSDGKVRALYMSEAEVSVEADKPLRRGTFTIYGQRVGVKAYGRRASTRFLVTASGSYRAELVDRDGFHCQEPLERTIESLADQEPTVEVYGADEILVSQSGAGGVSARFRAQDDYGIEKVRLVYHLEVLPGIRLTKERSTEPRKQERKIEPRRVVNMTLPCNFKDLGLEVGEVVVFHIEVEDTDVESGPHIARSKPRRLVVVGREMQEWIELEDEDRWPTDFVGFSGAKRAMGLDKPGKDPLVRDAAEKPNESSAGVTNAVEGFVPHQLRRSFSDYTDSLREKK